MRRIGLGLIEEKKREVMASPDQRPLKKSAKSSEDEDELDERTKGRDLLSVLSKGAFPIILIHEDANSNSNYSQVKHIF